jgi:hypothetical protein
MPTMAGGVVMHVARIPEKNDPRLIAFPQFPFPAF